MPLSGKQKNYLRGLAHSLKPVVQVGKAGASNEVFEDIKTKIDHHELIKIRIDCTDKEEMDLLVHSLSAEQPVEVVQVIGHTLVLYAPNPENPKIKLP